MVEAVVLAWSEPFRHRLNTLAVSGTDKSRHIKWTHLSPFLVSKLLQKRLQNAESSVSQSAISRPKSESAHHLKPGLPESAKVLLAWCQCGVA